MGYLENRMMENAKENDSSYVAKFRLGHINSLFSMKFFASLALAGSLLPRSNSLPPLPAVADQVFDKLDPKSDGADRDWVSIYEGKPDTLNPKP